MVTLYEDNHCLAVVKPHGLLTQGDETGDASLFDDVKSFIKERDNKPGEAFLGLLHRLDRPVGGVVLFAKTSKGASRLSEQFRARNVKKAYLAAVHGTPKAEAGEVHHWLLKDESKNIVRVVDKETSGAKEAKLSYRVLTTAGDRSFVEIVPETGRPHQIRVAMASLGTPIVGDLKYGSIEGHDEAIALFAARLEFFQPVTNEPIVVEARPEHPVFAPFV